MIDITKFRNEVREKEKLISRAENLQVRLRKLESSEGLVNITFKLKTKACNPIFDGSDVDYIEFGLNSDILNDVKKLLIDKYSMELFMIEAKLNGV